MHIQLCIYIHETAETYEIATFVYALKMKDNTGMTVTLLGSLSHKPFNICNVNQNVIIYILKGSIYKQFYTGQNSKPIHA